MLSVTPHMQQESVSQRVPPGDSTSSSFRLRRKSAGPRLSVFTPIGSRCLAELGQCKLLYES